MDWGDAPGWAALLVALGALEISRRARKDGSRSARASERSATAAEQTLVDQRMEAAERRREAFEEARPKAHLELEFAGGHQYRLRNVGTDVATGVVNVEPCGAVDEWPAELTLQPGEAHPFMISEDFENRKPTQLVVAWAGRSEPVVLPVH